jgi:hypothetical protein
MDGLGELSGGRKAGVGVEGEGVEVKVTGSGAGMEGPVTGKGEERLVVEPVEEDRGEYVAVSKN